MAAGQFYSVKVNFEDVVRQLGLTMTPRLRRAGIRAANRTADSERTALAREVAKDMGMKVGVVKDQIRVSKATDGRPNAYVIGSGKRIPVYALGARGPDPSRGKGRGVTAGRKRYPHAFLATMPNSGHRGVFQREGIKRKPIFEVTVASIGHVFGKLANTATAQARREAKLQKEITHEIEFALSRA